MKKIFKKGAFPILIALALLFSNSVIFPVAFEASAENPN